MGQGAAVLTPETLLPLLDRLQARRLWVGFSGGLDSTALLLALATLRETRALELRAVHANHGGPHDDAHGLLHDLVAEGAVVLEDLFHIVVAGNQHGGGTAAGGDLVHGLFVAQ